MHLYRDVWWALEHFHARPERRRDVLEHVHAIGAPFWIREIVREFGERVNVSDEVWLRRRRRLVDDVTARLVARDGWNGRKVRRVLADHAQLDRAWRYFWSQS